MHTFETVALVTGQKNGFPMIAIVDNHGDRYYICVYRDTQEVQITDKKGVSIVLPSEEVSFTTRLWYLTVEDCIHRYDSLIKDGDKGMWYRPCEGLTWPTAPLTL
jgi:hypothetical protein